MQYFWWNNWKSRKLYGYSNEEEIIFILWHINNYIKNVESEECMNTLFVNELKNYKLVLLYEKASIARIAIKMSTKLTKKMNISNTNLQKYLRQLEYS